MPAAPTLPRLVATCRATLLAGRDTGTAATMTAEDAILRCLLVRLCEDRRLVPPGTVAALATAQDLASRLADFARQYFALDTAPEPPATLPGPPLAAFLAALTSNEASPVSARLPLATLGHAYELLRRLDRRGDRGTRKAEGIFYTPPPLVDYLARRALAPLLADGPDLATGVPSVLDPTCGAGTLLLAAYDLLLAAYRDRSLAENAARQRGEMCQDVEGGWHLGFSARQRILLAHIYGVDRDPRALELARLTLTLAACPGDSAESALLSLDLARNLRCGDALLGPDIRDHPPAATLDAEQIAALRPLDWGEAFPAIMARGGFDAVLANPPYLSYTGRQSVALPAAVRAYLLDRHGDGGWPAAHSFLIVHAVRTLSRRRCAFVVPAQVGHLDGYAPVRATIARHTRLEEVRYWGERAFADATTPALTFVTDRAHGGPAALIEATGHPTLGALAPGAPWHLGLPGALLAKVRRHSESLGPLVGDPGVHTGNCARQLLVPLADAPPGAVPLLEGRQVGAYRCAAPTRALRLDYRVQPGEYFAIRPPARYADAPFVIRQTARQPIVGPRRGATYFRNSLLALFAPTDGRAVEYLVGLLNSTLLRALYRAEVREAHQESFPQVKVGALRRLPIRRLDLADPRDRAQHDAIVTTVRALLALHDSLAPDPDEVARQERALDLLVYALYDLTAGEIAQIEKQGSPMRG